MYGPSGAGKKTRIMCLLRELYGSGAEKLRIEHMNFTVRISLYALIACLFNSSSHAQTPSKKKLEISTVSSNYHVEINPSDAGVHDRVVIQELLKNMAQSQTLDTSHKSFKGK